MRTSAGNQNDKSDVVPDLHPSHRTQHTSLIKQATVAGRSDGHIHHLWMQMRGMPREGAIR